jgi:hypothetical protein
MSKPPPKDLRSRTQPEHVALLNRAAAAGEDDLIAAECGIADVLVELGWLELGCKLEYVNPQGETIPADVASYRITPRGLAVHAKAHGRSLSTPKPVQEAPRVTESDEPEPFGCGPRGRTYAAHADTWGLDR